MMLVEPNAVVRPPSNPSGLVAVDGELYGTTPVGGPLGHGIVFGVYPAGKEHTVYQISGGVRSDATLLSFGGDLYGTTSRGGTYHAGTVFGISQLTHKLNFTYEFSSKLNDGTSPEAPLIKYNKLLYGVTIAGGTSNDGTVFSIDPASGQENVLYSFKSGSDADSPTQNLTMLNGELYGTARFGGVNCNGVGCGVLYEVNPSTGAEKVLYAFQGGKDGETPSSGLLAMNGKLYGVTTQGGSTGCGTLFEFDPSANSYTILHVFSGSTSDGCFPMGNITSISSIIYGTTANGGAIGNGTVFQLNPGTQAESLVYSFQGPSDGISPSYGAIALKGVLYGTASAGGANNRGTVFSVTTAGQEKTLYAF